MAILAYSNRVLGAGAFTETTGTWATTPPIGNLATLQVPTPHAEVTPATGAIEFDWQAQDAAGSPENMTVQVLGLLAHTLPSGAVVSFLDGVTELAEITWAPLANRSRPANLIAVLDSPVTLQDLTVSIASAGADVLSLGALWASPLIDFQADRGADWQPTDYSLISRVNATPWIDRRTQADVVGCTASFIRDAQAWGTDNGVNFKGIFEAVQTTEPVIYIRRSGSQADIDRWSVYGQLAAPGRITHRQGPLNRVEFEVREIR